MTNILPLDMFRSLIGFHPFHFWGLADTRLIPVQSACDAVLREHPWQQSDQVGRRDIAGAIANAERLLTDYLGYSPAPRYTEFNHMWPLGSWAGATVQLPEGHVQALGVELLTTVQAGATVTYSDEDGDGLKETATVTVSTSVTDPTQISVYISAADRFDGSGLSKRWRVTPCRVTINSGSATIRVPSWLLVKPILYEGFGVDDLDPTDAANFVTTVDAIQRTTLTTGTTEATAQAVVTWPNPTITGWWCCDATGATGVAQAEVRNRELGLVTVGPRIWNDTASAWGYPWRQCQQPDSVTIRALAGYPLEADGSYSRQWATTVVRLAAAELARPICSCSDNNKELFRWQVDIAKTGPDDEVFGAVSADDLNNPLGTRRGHIYAYRRIKQLVQMRAVLA